MTGILTGHTFEPRPEFAMTIGCRNHRSPPLPPAAAASRPRCRALRKPKTNDTNFPSHWRHLAGPGGWAPGQRSRVHLNSRSRRKPADLVALWFRSGKGLCLPDPSRQSGRPEDYQALSSISPSSCKHFCPTPRFGPHADATGIPAGAGNRAGSDRHTLGWRPAIRFPRSPGHHVITALPV